ncbi:PREDICTED: probable inactive DNA (cytosine-5)-methyltransferase DRM3 [Nicotiana attenuata]|uniref:DNA (cytosine-5-)-methyltransferase n=1 Tax=Nicotiana attenuata TaxID=49451 RepID=A0A1J6IVY5_NICAT|nr:PREDICTED: probable inactive DNA (cytosine-5)-methyltransferase DRM3 [Nicotiana attenuata]OIT02947.1 dna (cytosine-5)-methyltransferase drm2 [Nicotiana attenuata]
MCELPEYSDSENSSKPEGVSGIMPKVEDPYCEFPSLYTYTRPTGDNIASSSGSSVRSSLLAMGFNASLVDKAIEENGEDNIDLLLETLVANSDPPRAESSDSLDSLFGDDEDTNSSAKYDGDVHIKEEPDPCGGVHDDKRASLLAMSFSLDEVEFAIGKLGEAAPVNELVNLIFAARIAQNCKKDDGDDSVVEIKEWIKECSTEAMFKIMEKTLKLLEMGFSENEVSAVIEKYGSEVPLEELANSIIDPSSGRMDKHLLNSLSRNGSIGFHPLAVKKEECDVDTSESRDLNLLEKLKGKRPKENYIDEINTLKRPKPEYDEAFGSSLGPAWQEMTSRNLGPFNTTRTPVSRRAIHQRSRVLDCQETPKLSMPKSCRTLDKEVAKAPYFFYGNVMNLSHDSWVRISQFLHAIEPEFVNTQLFSALSRKEGYVHNLPTENRFHIVPKPPLTIQEVVPNSKKWWPPWDTRQHLSCINSETSCVSQLCDRLERTVSDSQGFPAIDRQRDILHHCQILNLVWVGRYKLAPVAPEQIERILGYPESHTRNAGFSLMERLLSLKHCFQIDTLAYHLSVLKSLYPGGLTVLSIFTGTGGAEIALHRLGIRLKVVVSVEASEKNRRILKQWWSSSGQTGELVQIEDIQKLTSNKVEVLIKKFGGFDFIVCQSPCTYSSKGNLFADTDSHASLDFMLFHEFVRVLQRVRNAMGRK